MVYVQMMSLDPTDNQLPASRNPLTNLRDLDIVRDVNMDVRLGCLEV